jgi:hypothetical protein
MILGFWIQLSNFCVEFHVGLIRDSRSQSSVQFPASVYALVSSARTHSKSAGERSGRVCVHSSYLAVILGGSSHLVSGVYPSYKLVNPTYPTYNWDINNLLIGMSHQVVTNGITLRKHGWEIPGKCAMFDDRRVNQMLGKPHDWVG